MSNTVKRPTAQNFIELLEATHLIYRLPPFGYGKDVLRARFKIYLADAAIAPAVMLKGKAILEDPAALGVATDLLLMALGQLRSSWAAPIRLMPTKHEKLTRIQLFAGQRITSNALILART